MAPERPFLAHPARNAYARFMVFSDRTRLIGKDSKGSEAEVQTDPLPSRETGSRRIL